MAEQQPLTTKRDIAPKDVFQRSNMPSRWERITNVAPKTAPDRMYLSFVAARYRGDEWLPHPEDIEPPDDLYAQQVAQYGGLTAIAIGVLLTGAGLTAHIPGLAVTGSVLAIGALVAVVAVSMLTGPVIREYHAIRRQCALSESRLHADPMDSENTSTLNRMITCDEGTLVYCAAKIASEIEQDPAWGSSILDVVAVDLWDELAEVGESARQIAEDRRSTEALERGRLRDDPEVRATINEDKRRRTEAIALLAARIFTFADYRDRVHRHGMAALRDSNAVRRTVRLVADEQAIDRPL